MGKNQAKTQTDCFYELFLAENKKQKQYSLQKILNIAKIKEKYSEICNEKNKPKPWERIGQIKTEMLYI